MLDEVDKFSDGTGSKEAGALQLAEARVATYPNHLVVSTSTPTTADSIIWSEWQKGDMRFYFVPCPHCGMKQKLLWGQVKWDEKAKIEEAVYDFSIVKNSAYYECEGCRGRLPMVKRPRCFERENGWQPIPRANRGGDPITSMAYTLRGQPLAP